MARLKHYRKDPQSVTACGDHFSSSVGVSVWTDVTCPECLGFKPFVSMPKIDDAMVDRAWRQYKELAGPPSPESIRLIIEAALGQDH